MVVFADGVGLAKNSVSSEANWAMSLEAAVMGVLAIIQLPPSLAGKLGCCQ